MPNKKALGSQMQKQRQSDSLDTICRLGFATSSLYAKRPNYGAQIIANTTASDVKSLLISKLGRNIYVLNIEVNAHIIQIYCSFGRLVIVDSAARVTCSHAPCPCLRLDFSL